MTDTFKNILLLPYQYYRNRTTGEILSRINDMDNIREFITILITLITSLLLMVVSGILLFTINKTLFGITILILILYFLIYVIFNKKINLYLEQLKIKKSLLNSFITETISGFESIKGLNLQNVFMTKFENKNKEYLKNLKEFEILKLKLINIKNFLADISTILILFVGLYLIKQNILTFIDLLLFYTIFNYFLEPLKDMIEIRLMINNIKLSLKRVLELNYNNKEKITDKRILGNINFNGVSFEYENKCILDNVKLKIDRNDKVMIIGPSGSGKSTILKLLKQYYKTTNLYIDNKDIRKTNIKNNISYISQNEFLFTDTLYNNIVMNRKIDKENLDKILKICCLEEFINNKSLGLNMLIEENGFNLSGGEKQRIILARALISNFDYLFIDEGLSEVDINTERKIIKNLLNEYKNKTIIIVSHRLDNMDLLNRVIKVDEKLEILEKNRGGAKCLKKLYV